MQDQFTCVRAEKDKFAQIATSLEQVETPRNLRDVAAMLAVASRLTETAGYGAACEVEAAIVTDILLVAARLEARADMLRMRALEQSRP